MRSEVGVVSKKGPLLVVLGIRPDVIRASLILRQLRAELGQDVVFAWSGQHYSDNLKDIFFRQLDVAPPDIELGGSGDGDAETVAAIIAALAPVLRDLQPEATVFLGDTNTVMGSIACASLNVPVVHIEGCMRSYDWRMPEEKYRTVIDHLADVIYAYFSEYREQGIVEGLDPERIIVVDNPIVDVLEQYFLSGKIRLSAVDLAALLASVAVTDGDFLVMTAHRRENVETPTPLQQIFDLAGEAGMPVVFPASYRTQKNIATFGLSVPVNVRLIDPIGYTELLELIVHSAGVLTDSGTVVEEAAVLGIPTVQMRRSTERPQVYDCGGSVKFDPGLASTVEQRGSVLRSLAARRDQSWTHGLGDGKASERIATDLIARYRAGTFRGHAPDPARRPIDRAFGLGHGDLGRAET